MQKGENITTFVCAHTPTFFPSDISYRRHSVDLRKAKNDLDEQNKN